MSSTGRRPMRSEMRPHTGEKTNCISEKIENSTPITAPLASGERPVEVRLGLPRQHRQHDAEAEQVDEHDEPDDAQRGVVRLSASRGVGRRRGQAWS